MTNEELLQAITLQIGSFRNEMTRRMDEMENRLDSMEKSIASLQESVEGLEEDSEITRDGVNSLLEWADMIGKINNYPIAK